VDPVRSCPRVFGPFALLGEEWFEIVELEQFFRNTLEAALESVNLREHVAAHPDLTTVLFLLDEYEEAHRPVVSRRKASRAVRVKDDRAVGRAVHKRPRATTGSARFGVIHEHEHAAFACFGDGARERQYQHQELE